VSGRRILENSLAIKNLVQDRLERKIRQEHWLALVVREHRGPDLDKRRNIFERSSALSEPGKDKERKRTEVLGQTGSSSREVSEACGTAKFLRPTAKSFTSGLSEKLHVLGQKAGLPPRELPASTQGLVQKIRLRLILPQRLWVDIRSEDHYRQDLVGSFLAKLERRRHPFPLQVDLWI